MRNATREIRILCPVCDDTLDRFMGLTAPRSPRPGDILFCSSCACVLKLGASNQVTVVMKSDLSIPMLHRVRRMQRTLQEAQLAPDL